MDLIRKPLTEKQKKFAEIYCNSHGLLSNTECAIEAGYARDSAYQRSHELLNPEICPHVVKYIREIEDDIKTKFYISKDSHMAELWRIREEAKKKNQTLVRLRAEELRGKLMGYYVEKKQQLNVNKTLNDMSEEELENRMNQIHKQYSHFIDLKDPEKQLINAEVRGEQKAEKYKKGFDLATKLLRENGIKMDSTDVDKRIELLRSISQEPTLTDEQAKTQKALDDYQIRRKKERKNGKG